MSSVSLKEALLSVEADIQRIELECKSRSDKVKSEAMALAYDGFTKIGWTSWNLDDHCKSGQYERFKNGINDKKIKVVNIDLKNACGAVMGSALYNVSNVGCSCYDFATRHLPCKHMYCVANHILAKDETTEPVLKKIPEGINPLEHAEPNEQMKTYVLSGTITSMTREEMEHYIRAHGGKVSSSVSMKTDYLVAGLEAGAKLLKAKEFGVKIISEDELISLLGQK